MNRQQRRRQERTNSKPQPDDTLSGYLREPDLVVRRKELLGVFDKLIRLYEYRKRRNRWWWRLRRWIDDRESVDLHRGDGGGVNFDVGPREGASVEGAARDVPSSDRLRPHE